MMAKTRATDSCRNGTMERRNSMVSSLWMARVMILSLCFLVTFIRPSDAGAEAEAEATAEIVEVEAQVEGAEDASLDVAETKMNEESLPENESESTSAVPAAMDSAAGFGGEEKHEASILDLDESDVAKTDAAPTSDSTEALVADEVVPVEEKDSAYEVGLVEEALDTENENADYDDDMPMFDLSLAGDGEEDIVFQEIPSVYGVSKFEQKITEAPSFVTLITADEIKKYGHRTLAQVLQSVTGFFVTYDRNYNYLGVRGFNRPGDFNSRVLLLVDGHRLNDNLYDQAGLGTESVVDVDLIDRVEVIRGPSSSLYGTNAFFGVINVITKRGRDIKGIELSTEVGSFDTYRARVTYGDKFANGIELLLSGSYYDSEGQDFLFYQEFADDTTTNNNLSQGITRNADGDEFPNFLGKLTFRDVTLQGGFVSREKGIPTGRYDSFFPSSQTESTDEHAYVFAKYEHQFANQLNVSGRVYYDRFFYKGNYLFDFSTPPTPPDLVLNRDRSVGEWWGAELKVDKRFFEHHNVAAGLEYRDNFRQDLRNADIDPAAVVLDEERDSRSFAVFLQDEFSILDNLILNAGVRYDYYETFGSTVNPRIALIYNLEKTTFKALYGTAFRGPNAYERFYAGTGLRANPDLDPESITTYELVLEHSITPHIRVSATGYLYRIDDLVSETEELDDTTPAPFDTVLVFRNRGKTEAKGIELQVEMDHRGPLGIGGRLGYALQNAEDRRTKGRITNSPTHLVNLNLNAPIFEDKLFAGLEVFYTSKRKTLASNTTGDYTLANFTLTTKNLLRGLEVSTTVRNLFDREYGDPGSGSQPQDEIEQDGRSFWLKIKYGF